MSDETQDPTPLGLETARGYGQEDEHVHHEEVVDERDPDAPEPGHLGNDLSKMTLLETDLEQIAKADDGEPDPAIQEALADLTALTDKHDIPDSLDDH
ncbi:MAG: hypothetical protein Q4F65_08485 [Propionibacteriaceae bacterium]|nr:hypothetical protein [Propionibacteriaceae bacterium]